MSFDRWSDVVARVLLAIAALLAFLLSFLIIADIVGRSFFNRPLQGTPEIISMSIVIICFLQASYAVRSGGMLRVEILDELVSTRAGEILATIRSLLGFAFFAIVFWGALDPFVHAWISNEFEGEGARHIPAWPARLAVVVGCALASINYLQATIRHSKRVLGRGD